MAGGFSDLSFLSVSRAPATIGVLFSSFAGTADFTNVGAIQFVFDGNGVQNLDTDLAGIEVTGPSPIPLPASALLLGGALLGMGGMKVRRLRKAA